MLVDVHPTEPLELAEPHSCGVKHEERQPVASGEEVVDGLDVLGGRRCGGLGLMLPRQLHRDLVGNGLAVVTPA